MCLAVRPDVQGPAWSCRAEAALPTALDLEYPLRSPKTWLRQLAGRLQTAASHRPAALAQRLEHLTLPCAAGLKLPLLDALDLDYPLQPAETRLEDSLGVPNTDALIQAAPEPLSRRSTPSGGGAEAVPVNMGSGSGGKVIRHAKPGAAKPGGGGGGGGGDGSSGGAGAQPGGGTDAGSGAGAKSGARQAVAGAGGGKPVGASGGAGAAGSGAAGGAAAAAGGAKDGAKERVSATERLAQAERAAYRQVR